MYYFETLTANGWIPHKAKDKPVTKQAGGHTRMVAGYVRVRRIAPLNDRLEGKSLDELKRHSDKIH